MKEREITGARVLLECLKRLGVKDIFGYPGGSVIPIYDEIYSFEGIKHYLSRHEQGAVHGLMAMLELVEKWECVLPLLDQEPLI